MSGADQIGVLDHAQGNILHSGIVIPLRRWTLGVFNSTLSGNHKALLSGFLLGETRDIPKRVYDMFRDTGTVHLLAVSGSNVWLVIGVILGALSLLRVPRFPATLLGLVCIFVFANLVHNDPPVVRAGIMAAVMLVGVLLYRDVDLVNVVSFSGLVILLYSPLFLFDVGFQLSFASVFAILLLYPRLSELVLKYVGKSHRKLWKWIIMPALISVSVELVLFPILAYYFNMIPLIIVVANIFIVPLAGLSVVLACFTLFSAVFSSGLAGIFSACNWLCLDLTLRLTEFFANLPVAKLSVPAPSVSTFMVYYFFLWLLVSSIASKRKTIVFSVLIIANLFVWREGLAHRDAPLKLTILDVSQGSCAVLDLPNGQTFLLNVGQKAKNFDAGEYAVIPYLNHKGTAKIDKLILTDTDSSSLNSVGSVLKEVDVERILLSDFAPWGQKGDVYPVARESSQVQSLESLRAITDEKGEFEIRFFQYPKSRRPKLISDEMLTLIRYRDIAFCLFDGMKRVHFNPEFDWDNVRDCSVLVLSELGDANEIVQVISAIRPQKLLFTRHYFRHEKNKIPLLMQQNFPGIEYYRTAENGAITCETDGERLRFDLTIR
jgi:competence protein ComEC